MVNKKKFYHFENIFRMIKLLRENERIKNKDLVKELGVLQPKSITRYKSYIEMLGYKIDVKFGHYGGYKLVEEKLEEEEILFLKSILANADAISLYDKIIRIINRV